MIISDASADSTFELVLKRPVTVIFPYKEPLALLHQVFIFAGGHTSFGEVEAQAKSQKYCIISIWGDKNLDYTLNPTTLEFRLKEGYFGLARAEAKDQYQRSIDVRLVLSCREVIDTEDWRNDEQRLEGLTLHTRAVPIIGEVLNSIFGELIDPVSNEIGK